MRKLITFAITVLGLAALLCTPRANAQTYKWAVKGNQSYQEGVSGGSYLTQTVPGIVTSANIVTSRDTGCDTEIIDTISVTSGPAPLIGEYAQASGGFQPQISEIVNVVQNPDGSYDITLNRFTCEGFPVRSGVESIGPAMHWYLFFDTHVQPYSKCDSGKSSVTAGFLDASGNLQSAPSASGTVTCSLASVKQPNGVYYLVATVNFSGTARTGQAFTATATINSEQGYRGFEYAQSATWTITVQ